jgi:hypothetical protein
MPLALVQAWMSPPGLLMLLITTYRAAASTW